MPLDDHQISRMLESWRPILLAAQKQGMILSFSCTANPDGDLFFSITATMLEPEPLDSAFPLPWAEKNE